MLVIGGSAGSLEVLINVLPHLRNDLALAIVVVMHRKPGESFLTDIIASKTSWPVKEAEEKEAIQQGHIYIAPADYHLLLEKDRTFSLDFSEKIHFSRPAIDATFETASEAYGGAVIGVLLSGANADGASGLGLVKKAGGLTIVQDPSEAAVPYMPEQAIQQVTVDYIATTTMIIDIINRIGQ